MIPNNTLNLGGRRS